MAVPAKQKYDPAKVDKLQEYLRLYNQKGRPIDYEIIVDGLRAVRRTSDPEEFSDHERFITPETRSIEINLYNGGGNSNEKHIFFLSDEEIKQGLSGLEIDSRISEQVERQRREWQFDLLQKENAELKAEVAELERENENLEKEKQALIENQSPLKGFLGEIGSSFVESFIRRNPSVMKSIPGGEALAGLIATEPKVTLTEDDTSVSFQERSQELDESDRSAIEFVNQLKQQFSKSEFDNVLIIIQALANDKSRIDLIINHINLK